MATHTHDFSYELVAKIVSIQRNLYVEIGKRPIQYYLNCWELVKLTKPQRKHEIKLSVKVTKVERISQMA